MSDQLQPPSPLGDGDHPIDRASYLSLSHPEKMIWVEQVERESGLGTFECLYCGKPFERGRRREFGSVPGVARRAGARFCCGRHRDQFAYWGPMRVIQR